MYGIDYCYYAAPNEKETNLYFIYATLLLAYYIWCLPLLNVVFVYER